MGKSTFETLRYEKVAGLFEPSGAAGLFEYVQERASSGVLRPDYQVPTAAASYGDPLMDQLLLFVQPRIERLCDAEVFPTYSYYRLYRCGDVLRPHRDRKACEISVTVNLGQAPEKPWPIWIRGPHGADSIELFPGDALVYRGIECEHWREPYDGYYLGQVFLHYVDARGPNARWRFDKRPTLNIASSGASLNFSGQGNNSTEE
jgi:hypothetical protein